MKKGFKERFDVESQKMILSWDDSDLECPLDIGPKSIVVENYYDEDVVCFYHDNCTDGFTAAYLLKKALPHAEIRPASYGKDLDMDEIDKDTVVFFVDFSTKRDQMIEIAKNVKHVVVIDHHVSAEKELVDLPDNVDVYFNMDKSGAMMVFNFFWYARPPMILRAIQARDLWTFDVRGANEIAMYIRTIPFTIENWHMLFDESYDTLVNIGESVLRYHMIIVESLKHDARKAIINGVETMVVNAHDTFSSDLGHSIVSDGYRFAVTWYEMANGKIKLGFRSDGEFDVSELAQSFGGGGHKAASGAVVDSIEEVVDEWIY